MLKNRKFILFFTSTFFSSFGDATLFVILLGMLQNMGEKAVGTSFYFIFSALPVLLFGLHVGAYVEKKSLQKIMVYSDFIRIALLVVFYMISFYTFESVILVYILIFSVTSINIFFHIASATLIPHILSSGDIPKANSLFRMVNMTAKLLSYSFAALLFKLDFTVYQCLILVTVFYFFSVISVSLIRPYFQNTDISEDGNSLFISIKEGFFYIKNDKVISRLFLVFGLGWIVGSAIDLYLISYLKEVLGKGAESLFLITTPTIIGIIIGSLISPMLYKKLDKKYGFLFSLFAFGLTILCFSMELPLLILQFLLVIGGISQGVLNIFLVSYLQTNVDTNYLSRVFSFYNIIYTGGSIPGFLLFGYLIDSIGVIKLGFILSSYLFLVGVICFVIIPSLRTEKIILENPVENTGK